MDDVLDIVKEAHKQDILGQINKWQNAKDK